MRANTRNMALTSVRWTTKNRIYLERLGFLDARNGRKKKGTHQSLNDFINRAITIVCEDGMLLRGRADQATSDELRAAWIKMQVRERQADIERLYAECRQLAKLMPEKPDTPDLRV